MKTKPVLQVLLILIFTIGCKRIEKGLVLLKDENTFEITADNVSLFSKGVVTVGGIDYDKITGFEMVLKPTEKKNVAGFYLKNTGGSVIDGNQPTRLLFSDIEFKEGLAFYRYGPWKAWTKPVRIENLKDFPSNNVQCFLYKRADDVYVVMIPLSGYGFRSTLGAGEGLGAISLAFVDQYSSSEIPLFAIGYGYDPYSVIADTYAQGMKLMGLEQNLRTQKSYPEIFEYIGWCTWNGLGNNLSKKRISDALQSFKNGVVMIPNLIIDDGWHSINSKRQLTSFEPDVRKFPGGFQPLIDHLKKKYNVRNVGAWLTLNGYWNGVDPGSDLGKAYNNELFRFVETDTLWINSEKEIYYVPTPVSTNATIFFDQWFNLLEKQGVSFLKVDNQLVVERIARNQLPIWEAAKNMHYNLRQPAEKYFNSAIINCMDMTNDAFYHFGNSAVARAVEDYFPYEEGETYNLQKGNAAAHVLSAIYNSLYFSQMVWPDFDMFQTHNPNGEYHAVVRAISGGPVYLTDTPGEQNFEIIKKLTYSDGRIVRSDQPLLPTEDCLFQVQKPKPLKAFTFAGKTGILGIWNAADSDQVIGTFKVEDIHGIEGKSFVLYNFFNDDFKVVSKSDEIEINLSRMDYELFFAIPEGIISPIGLTNKYNAPSTITTGKLKGNMYEVELYEGGTFKAVCRYQPTNVLVNDKPFVFLYEEGLLNVKIPVELRNVKLQIIL